MADIELTDAQIVEVLASLGIDATESKYGFDVLQVRTTVHAIRDIVKAYSAAIAEQAKGQAAPMLVVKRWEERLRLCPGQGDVALSMEAEIIDLRAALAICAEEARREGWKQGRAAGQLTAEVRAQRTAGRDAEKVDHNSDFDKACGAFYREHGRLPAPIEIFVIARATQPVAEAAAQADDVLEKSDWPYEFREELARRFLAPYADANGEKLLDYEVQPIIRRLAAAILEWQSLDNPAAAPTAQPTPREQSEARQRAKLQARFATRASSPASADFDLPAQGDAAQPTPPDDERTVGASIAGHRLLAEDLRIDPCILKPMDDERASPTFMDERQAQDWAWKAVRKDCGAGTWTTGESGNYFGFFLHGWRYREQYDKQRRAALRQPGALPDEEPEYKAVGEAKGMPATGGGFTMCAFNGADVPSGAVLFIRIESVARAAAATKEK